jgi:hypothetical protein
MDGKLLLLPYQKTVRFLKIKQQKENSLDPRLQCSKGQDSFRPR